MEIENLTIDEIINKEYKMMTSKEKVMFKKLKTKHLKREQLIKIICNLLLGKEDVEEKLSLYIRNQYITKKESISSIKREKSAKRELISDKIQKKKRGRTKGDKNITSEIIKKIENVELHDGDYYKGIKIKLTAADGETECKDCGSKLIDTGMKQYTVKIESEPMKLQLLVIEKPVMKCGNLEDRKSVV